MIVYFNKKTEQIVLSREEMYQHPKGISITVYENGKLVQQDSDLDYIVLMPEEARDFQDPRLKDARIHKCRVILDKNKRITGFRDHKNRPMKYFTKEQAVGEIKKRVRIQVLKARSKLKTGKL